MARSKTALSEQSKQFIDAARALECDESEERFDAALAKVARHKPPGAATMSDKETKTAEELKALVDEELAKTGVSGTQWIKIVPADPSSGANWRISHSGPHNGHLAETIARVYEKLKKVYDMR